MLKQSDAVIIFVVFAAVVGVFMLSSNTASLVIVAALASVFGGLIGHRLRKSQGGAEDQAATGEHEVTQASADDKTAQPTASAMATAYTGLPR